MKRIIKLILFIFIFLIIWNCTFSILWLHKNNISLFYEEEKNTLDIIYIGSSNVDQHFNSVLAYHLYGFTTGMMSTGTQPFVATKYLIEESRKTQKPYLYVIDLIKSQDEFVIDLSYDAIREVTDAMKFSKNRIDTINYVLKNYETDKSEYVNYYFSYLKYHNSWKYIYIDNTIKDRVYKGGYNVGSFEKEPQQEIIWNNEINEILPKNKEALMDLINYIKETDINVLFVVPKINLIFTPDQERINGAVKILEENGLPVINFNKVTDLNIDYENDFYEAAHLNIYGATKYTLYFSKYLKQHYNLPDHRSNESYLSWDYEYERFKKYFKENSNLNFEELVKEYSKYYDF